MNGAPPDEEWESRWKPVQTATQRLLEAARMGEWEAAAVLYQKRAALIHGVLDSPMPPAQRASAAQAVEQLLSAEAELSSLAEAAHEEIERGLETALQARRLNHTYG